VSASVNGAGRSPAAEGADSVSVVGGVASGLGPYVRALGLHWKLVLAITLASVLACAAWIAQREASYEATARVLVTPVPDTDNTFVGVSVVRAGLAEPSRAVETAVSLVDTRSAAEATASALGQSPEAVEEAVEVEALEASNIIEVRAVAGDPGSAAELANAFSEAALEERAEVLRPQIEAQIDELRSAIRELPVDDAEAVEMGQRLNRLRSVEGDPTLSIAEPAEEPSQPRGVPPLQALALSLLAGFVLAAVTAILIELLAPRPVRGVPEIVQALPLGVLARIPALGASRGSDRRATEAATAVREGFRSIRVQLALAAAGDDRLLGDPRLRGVVVISSANRGDGRTSSALALARAVIDAGGSALVVDLDLRKPELAPMLGAHPGRDLGDLALGAPVAEIAEPVHGLPRLSVVAAPRAGSAPSTELVASSVETLFGEARALADCVIVDTPPLGPFADALEIARRADHVVAVARIGNTTAEALGRMREALYVGGIAPRGFVVIDPAARSRGVALPFSSRSRRPQPASRA